jgi:predicted O-linked N-acetylglucosamine transferase (SPINDLY family)
VDADPQARKIAALLDEARRAHSRERLRDAQALYQQVLDLEPRQPHAWLGLALVARAAGAADSEIGFLARAVESDPDAVELRLEYGAALERRGALEAVEEQWREICRLRPDVSRFREGLGIVRQALGETAAAAQAYGEAYALEPSALRQLKRATLFSPISRSRASIAAERRDAEAAMDAILAGPRQDLGDPMHAAPWPHFYTAYGAECDRDLHAKLAAVYLHLFPSLDYVAPHCRGEQPRERRRLRVGLVSRFFQVHSIGRTSRGFFSQLSRDEFEAIAIFIAPTVDDAFSRAIRAQADRSIDLPPDLGAAREALARERLDVLFYQDIGMEPFGYFLAFSRLAPVQCVSFGHPDTTGIPAMDYFVSNDRYEPDGAERHYSERLFLLHGLPTLAYYEPPERGDARCARADFGLADADHVYLCPQSLFKFHPDMDALLAAILRRDPAGKLVVIEGLVPHWTQLLRQRWEAAMPEVADRIRFLPRMAGERYVDLIEAADVMLDTLHFNGMNTSLEAFAAGTPVVTWPGEFQRGRHTQAMYRAMGIEEAIVAGAGEYIARALELGTNPRSRAALRSRILERNAALYRDARVIREFERFFREAAGMGTRA